MGMKDLFLGYGPEVITGLTGAVPNDYGLATSLYLANLAREYNVKLAESLGIDISTPEKYKEFIKSNPKAYKHPILKHQLGYGLISPTLGGIIQSHVIKNKLNRLQSLDSSEINNERNFDMFDEILKAYKVCEDKTTFLAGMVPEEVRPELLTALDTEDKAKFDSILATVQLEPAVTEEEEAAIEPNESEIQVGDQPEVVDTTADIPAEDIVPPVEDVTQTSTLPDGEVGTLINDPMDVIEPTIHDVAKMTTEVQSLDNLDDIPEDLREGIEIWKDADEDFSVKIVAETVKRLYGGDFSESIDVTEGDILITGAEAAKDLKEAGEHKTSLTKGLDEIEKNLDVQDLAKLYSVLGELKTVEESVRDFVDEVTEKDDVSISPSKKEELVQAILNNGLFEGDDVKIEVTDTLESVPGFGDKTDEEKEELVTDFSTFNPDMSLSQDTCDILEGTRDFSEAVNCVFNAISIYESDPAVLQGFKDFSIDCATQMLEDSGLSHDFARTEGQQLVMDLYDQRQIDSQKPRFLWMGDGTKKRKFRRVYDPLMDPKTKLVYSLPSALGQVGSAIDTKYGTDGTYQQLAEDLGDIVLRDQLLSGHPGINPATRGKKSELKVVNAPVKAAAASCGDESCGDMAGKQTTLYEDVKSGLGKLKGSIGKDDLISGAIGATGAIATKKIIEDRKIKKAQEEAAANPEANVAIPQRGGFLSDVAVGTLGAIGTTAGYKGVKELAGKIKSNKEAKKADAKQEEKSGDSSDSVDLSRIDWDKVENADFWKKWLKENKITNRRDPNIISLDAPNPDKDRNGKVRKRVLSDYVGLGGEEFSTNPQEVVVADPEVAENPNALTPEDKRNLLIGAGALAAIPTAYIAGKEIAKAKARGYMNKANENKNRNGGFTTVGKAYNTLALDSTDSLMSKLTGRRTVSKDQLKEFKKIIKDARLEKKSGDHSQSDFAENEDQQQLSQDVINNAISNDDQIRALVEKYKMLPTVEAKDQMRVDMQTLGFTDDVINMIVQYSEGNFSAGDPVYDANGNVIGIEEEDPEEKKRLSTPAKIALLTAGAAATGLTVDQLKRAQMRKVLGNEKLSDVDKLAAIGKASRTPVQILKDKKAAKSKDHSEEEEPVAQDPNAPQEDIQNEPDVAGMVFEDYFDKLLPNLGATDPVDGTLMPGQVEAEGTELGHLGTIDQGIPSGEVVEPEDKEVAKVEITNSDVFEDILR